MLLYILSYWREFLSSCLSWWQINPQKPQKIHPKHTDDCKRHSTRTHFRLNAFLAILPMFPVTHQIWKLLFAFYTTSPCAREFSRYTEKHRLMCNERRRERYSHRKSQRHTKCNSVADAHRCGKRCGKRLRVTLWRNYRSGSFFEAIRSFARGSPATQNSRV